jgi:hypothetical protein
MKIESSEGRVGVTQFSVFLHNRAGALFSIVKLLQDAQIHTLGLTVQDAVDVSVVRLILSDPESAETIFMERGIPFGTCELLVLELPSGVDDLQKSLHGLFSGETNIHFLYPLLVRPNGRPVMALHVEDIEVAAGVLQANGLKVLGQADLTR